MTRKHFEALAAALKNTRTCWSDDPEDADCQEQAQWRATVKAIANVCAASNGMFDRGRFYAACGYDA